MNLAQSVQLFANGRDANATPQKDNAGMAGKPWRVVDRNYGHVISEWDTYDEAKNAMDARPESKILHQPVVDQLQKTRVNALRKLIRENPDIDGTSAAPTEGSSLADNNAANGPQVRDIARKRLVKTNPDVD